MRVEELTDDDWERGRKAVEDVLIEHRDSGIMLPFRNNGLVCKYADGSSSDIIRLPIEWALQIGLEAIEKGRSS